MRHTQLIGNTVASLGRGSRNDYPEREYAQASGSTCPAGQFLDIASGEDIVWTAWKHAADRTTRERGITSDICENARSDSPTHVNTPERMIASNIRESGAMRTGRRFASTTARITRNTRTGTTEGAGRCSGNIPKSTERVPFSTSTSEKGRSSGRLSARSAERKAASADITLTTPSRWMSRGSAVAAIA